MWDSPLFVMLLFWLSAAKNRSREDLLTVFRSPTKDFFAIGGQKSDNEDLLSHDPRNDDPDNDMICWGMLFVSESQDVRVLLTRMDLSVDDVCQHARTNVCEGLTYAFYDVLWNPRNTGLRVEHLGGIISINFSAIDLLSEYFGGSSDCDMKDCHLLIINEIT